MAAFNTIVQGDCVAKMAELEAGSVDFVLTTRLTLSIIRAVTAALSPTTITPVGSGLPFRKSIAC